jgi:hypothetical protein
MLVNQSAYTHDYSEEQFTTFTLHTLKSIELGSLTRQILTVFNDALWQSDAVYSETYKTPVL